MISREMVRGVARLGFWCALAVSYVAAVMPRAPSLGGGDKLDHIAAFATLAVLARLGWSRGRARWIAAGLVAFGALIELSQALPIVGRDASWYDLFADAIAVGGGLAIGTVLLDLIRRLVPASEAR